MSALRRPLCGLVRHVLPGLGLALLLGACAPTMERLAQVGKPPPLSPIENPKRDPGYEPVTLPMPQVEIPPKLANSLWRPGAKAFFKDQRASRVGDIVTVNITINDSANISNQTERSRDNSDNSSLDALLGYERSLNQVLPEEVNPSKLLDIKSTTNNKGVGTVDRKEDIKFKIAALVTQVLPNGNLVIFGRQEVRVNFEKRELSITGVVRPQDISASNAISFEKIAEARIAYGGHGQITDVQQPRYGSQILDIIFPF